MTSLSLIAEQRLRQAEAKGELSNLPGQGQALVQDPAFPFAAELRVAYKILKNHGALPQEVQMLKRIDELRQEIEHAPDSPHAPQQLAELEALCLAYNLKKKRPAELELSALKSDPRQHF